MFSDLVVCSLLLSLPPAPWWSGQTISTRQRTVITTGARMPSTRLRLAEVRRKLSSSWRLAVVKWTRMERTWPRVTMMKPDSVDVASRLATFLVLVVVVVMYFTAEGWRFLFGSLLVT